MDRTLQPTGSKWFATTEPTPRAPDMQFPLHVKSHLPTAGTFQATHETPASRPPPPGLDDRTPTKSIDELMKDTLGASQQEGGMDPRLVQFATSRLSAVSKPPAQLDDPQPTLLEVKPEIDDLVATETASSKMESDREAVKLDTPPELLASPTYRPFSAPLSTPLPEISPMQRTESLVRQHASEISPMYAWIITAKMLDHWKTSFQVEEGAPWSSILTEADLDGTPSTSDDLSTSEPERT